MFWLKVKKEYILENFEDLFAYLKDFPYNTEKLDERSDFLSTIQCMEELCDEVGHRLAVTPVYYPLPEDIDPIKTIRLMGLTLLAEHKSGRDTSAVMTSLANLIPFISKNIPAETLSRLQRVVISAMSGKQISDLKFTWATIERDGFNLQFFINRIGETVYRNSSSDKEIIGYEGKGCLHLLPDGTINLYPEMNLLKCQKTNAALQVTADDRIRLYVSPENADTPKNFKERYSSYNFVIDAQKQVQPSVRKNLKKYAVDDTVRIRVIDFKDGYPLPKVIVETIDPEYENLRGILNVWTNDKFRPDAQKVLKSVQSKDVFISKYKVAPNGENRFDITEEFEKAYRLSAAESTAKTVLAIYDSSYRNGYQLLTEDGVRVGMETSKIDELSDDIRQEFINTLQANKPVRVTFYYQRPPLDKEKFNMYCFPAADPFPFDDKPFDRSKASYNMIDACLEKMVIDAGGTDAMEYGAKVDRILTDQRPVVALARLLWRQTAASSLSPAERLTYLSIVAILSRLSGQEKDVDAVTVERSYLSRLVAFAGNSDVMPLKLSEAEIAEIPNASACKSVVDALASYKSRKSGLTAAKTTEYDAAKIVDRVESLVKASNEIVDIVGDIELNNIKREIARTIGAEEEYMPILSKRTHYGMENSTQEFKTSIVFPPLNRQSTANHNYQKWAILKTVCGFLNSRTGGKLILGVNDGGYAEGVEGDIAELYRQRLINEPNLDRYRTYVQLLIDNTFVDRLDSTVSSLDITGLNVTYEDEVNDEGKQLLHIHVKPYPYGVVKFNNRPRPADFSESYVRRSGSTIPLTQQLEQEIMAYKTARGSSENTAIVSLRSALINKKVVILKDYASASGVQDREIEPYRVWPHQGMVYGYDRGRREGRIFKIARCSRVEISSKGWTDRKCSPNVNLDPFGFLVEDSKAIDVRLLLTSYAAQLLKEEHPDAPIAANTSVSKNKFPFEMHCKVSALEGITRFCLGLPGETEIAAGKGLANHISSKAQELINL